MAEKHVPKEEAETRNTQNNIERQEQWRAP